MTLPHEITLPSGAVLTVTSIEPSANELRGFEARIGRATVRSVLYLYLETQVSGDFTDAMDRLTALANEAHEQQEADDERDKARHRCGETIFSRKAGPSR